MRKIGTVKIDIENPKKGEDPIIKEFVVKELTVQQIMDLTQTNELFGIETGKKSEDGQSLGFLADLKNMGKELQKVMKETCDFELEELKPLAPSEIKEIFDKFKEVNSDFLQVLEKLKITEIYSQMLMRATDAFSKTLVPLLNQGM